MLELKNYIKLSSKISIYVPATEDVNRTIDNKKQVDETAAFLANCFGGSTSSAAVGYWVSNTAGLVRENTTIVFAYASDTALKNHIDDVVQYCFNLKSEMKQESIAIEINGEMYFI